METSHMSASQSRFPFLAILGFSGICLSGMGSAALGQLQQPERYPPEAIREDFATLYRDLQDSAYDLFLFTEKAEFDAEYEKIMGSITEPMTGHQVGRLFQPFAVMANISHCTMSIPTAAYRAWYRSGGHWFPFDLVFDGERALIGTDWSQTEGIDPGDELLAVHGMGTTQLVEELFRFVVGETDQAKRASLETGELWSKYWLSFGEFEPGQVRIRKEDGREVELDVSGIDLEGYRILSESLSEPTFMRSGRDFSSSGISPIYALVPS